MKYLGFVCLFFILNQVVRAQKIFHGLKYDLKTGVIASSKTNTPFFLQANQFGLIPGQSGIIYFSGGFSKEYDSLFTIKRNLKKFGLGYGANLHTNFVNTNQVLLPEAYIKIRYSKMEFYAGRRREIQGLTDSTLTSGAYVWSGNALPVPKLQVSTPNWVAFGKNHRISFKGGLSHGWFGTQGIVENYYLHQKWVYLKINDKKQKVQLMGGINHQVQWGGYSEELKKIGGIYPPTINGYLAPNPLYSYQFIILPFLQKLVNIDPAKVPGYDGGLAIGNQLGSVDLSAIFNSNWTFYHQKPFDFARSLINFNNIEDGIFGFSWRNKRQCSLLAQLNGEFIYTKSQGLYRFGKLRPNNFGENDNYFAHGQYQSWSYNGRIIGTPFISVNPEIRNITGNRIKAFHLATIGRYKDNWFTLKANHQINFGIYGKPTRKPSTSFLLAVQRSIPLNLILEVQIAQDIGNLFGNHTGIHMAVKRNSF
jgi:hypothetical protein